MKNYTSSEIVNIAESNIQAAIVDVDDTTEVFDGLDGVVQPRPVPGHPKMQYVPWGSDNLWPYELRNRIGEDEVMSQNMHFNACTCYGGGVEFRDKKTNALMSDDEFEDWMEDNDINSYFLEAATDMKFYFWTVTLIVLNREQTRINAIYHKDTCHCRLEYPDKRGRINHIFYADWSQGEPDTPATVYTLLDMHNPLKDLRQLLGMIPGRDGKTRKRTNATAFAIIRRFPTVGCQFYPSAYYISLFRSGMYDEKRLISEGKRAKLRNHVGIKYLVEVNHEYWDRICEEEDITDEEEIKKRVKLERERIRDFVAGIQNSGKAWISGFMDDGEGHIIPDIKITNLEAGKEGGDWQGDNEAVINAMSFGMGVHTNLVGAQPGKSQTNNSGSDKRELFTMKQAMEKPYHDIMLSPLTLVCRFNGWNCRPAVPFLMLTTLDEHTDAKKVSTNGNTED